MQYKLKYYGLSLLSAVTLAAVPASAQQITGDLGSPSATTTIDGKQLPPPDPKFGGVIKDNAIKVDRPQLSPENIKNPKKPQRNNKMSE